MIRSDIRPHPRRPAARRRSWLATGLLACGLAWHAVAGAASGQTLPALDRLVRGVDPGAVRALQDAGPDYADGAPYPARLAYLKLLRQAYADGGDAPRADETDGRIAQLGLEQGDAAAAALGQLGRIGRLAAQSAPAALEALVALDARYAQLHGADFTAALQQAYGDVYLHLGQFDFALSHYLKALDMCRQHPELLNPTANGLRLAIAKVYFYTHAPRQVLQVLGEIVPAGGALPPRSAVRLYVNQGIAHASLHERDQARAYYQKGIALAHANGLDGLEANATGNLADTYLVEHRWDEAERTARAALALAERAGEPVTIRFTRLNLGFALAGRGDLAGGLAIVDGVAAEMRAQNLLPDLANLLAEKSRALEQAGRVADALAALREQQSIQAQLSTTERESAVGLLQDQFNAQRRAAQVEWLRRENTLKDAEIRTRRLWQGVAWSGAAIALALCGYTYLLYQRSARTGRRLQELNDELAFHSTHDALTGLLNRRSFRATMETRAPAGAQCFILLDIDHFKAINDRLGHAVGDEVLVQVAHRLRAAADGRALALRWGGEEFLVYMDGGVVQDHAHLVRDLLDAVTATPVALAGGEAVAVTITAGAVTLAPAAAAALDWQQALGLADQALYLGKEGGRNRANLAETGEHGAAPLRLTLIRPAGAEPG